MKIPLSPVRAVALAAALALLVAGCATATRSPPSAGSGGPPAVATVNTASAIATPVNDQLVRVFHPIDSRRSVRPPITAPAMRPIPNPL